MNEDPVNNENPHDLHDLHAERVTLGAMMLTRRAAEEVMDVITQSQDFYGPHQTIFEVIVDMATRGDPTDVVAVNSALAHRGEITRTGGAAYLYSLTEAVPSAANAGYYANVVATKAVLRRLVETGTRIAQYGHQGEGDVSALVERARADVDSIEAPVEADTAATVGELFWPVVDDLESQDDPVDAVELPYRDLQEVVPGLRRGQLTVVGARPSVGKSIVGVDIARHAAIRHDVSTVVFSMEMTKQEIMYRILSAEATVDITRMRTKQLTTEDGERILKVQERLDKAPLVLDDAFDASLAHIRTRLRKVARTRPVGLVIVDYLQLMQTGGRVESRQLEVARLARGLKSLAHEFNVPVVLLSQLNRESERRGDKTPTLADLRESGAIEQDSDVVVLLYREDMHEKDSPRAGEIDLIVEKNRQGARGRTVTCAFQGHYSRVVDMAGSGW